MTSRLILILLLVATTASAQPRRPRFNSGKPLVHDPVVAFEDSVYHLFATGRGIMHITSDDLRTWDFPRRPVLENVPEWTRDSVAGFEDHVWAPDIIRWHGRWYMGYSCSTFGRNTSAIGLASRETLGGDGQWRDDGCIIASRHGRDDWNAIDPCFVIDGHDSPWLFFGSFWDGIQLVRLDSTMHVAEGARPFTVARRYPPAYHAKRKNPTSRYAGTNAIEAPFVYWHDGFYYLFVSWDYCCRGAKSDYRVAVGRSRNVAGPYVDRDGVPMLEGGGTLFIEGDKTAYEAMGHCAVYNFQGRDLFFCHGYSLADDGQSVLYKTGIKWETLADGTSWPVAEQ